MAVRAEQLEPGRWTPDRLSELYERCSSQATHAAAAGDTARQQLADARRRRDQARQRAGARILPMWRARRARYDRFGPVLCMWSDGRSPGPEAAGRRWPYRSAGAPVVVADAAAASAPAGASDGAGGSAVETGPAEPGGTDMLVRALFEISLVVTSCRTQTDGAVAGRLDEVVDKLDRLIRDVRLAALQQVRRGERSAGGDPASMEDRGTVLARLRGVSEDLFRLADGKSDGSGALHWRDAAQCVSRAVQVLNEDTLG